MVPGCAVPDLSRTGETYSALNVQVDSLRETFSRTQRPPLPGHRSFGNQHEPSAQARGGTRVVDRPRYCCENGSAACRGVTGRPFLLAQALQERRDFGSLRAAGPIEAERPARGGANRDAPVGELLSRHCVRDNVFALGIFREERPPLRCDLASDVNDLVTRWWKNSGREIHGTLEHVEHEGQPNEAPRNDGKARGGDRPPPPPHKLDHFSGRIAR